MPREVHIHVTRYAIADIPTDDAAVEDFVRQRFAEKEKRLARFVTHSLRCYSAIAIMMLLCVMMLLVSMKEPKNLRVNHYSKIWI
jgi:hypothetical protein